MNLIYLLVLKIKIQLIVYLQLQQILSLRTLGPILRKFTTVFYPALTAGEPKMKFIGNRNKAKVTIIGKAKDPYLSISFSKGIEDIQIPVFNGK